MVKKSLGILCVVVFLLSLSSIVFAADSPQFRGVARTGVFPETGLLPYWPEQGPPIIWVVEGIGHGFSSAIVVQGKVYVTGMLEDAKGHLFVIDESEGRIENTYFYGVETLDEQAPGPRSTPTWHKGRLYFLSGLGRIYCMDAATGEIVWSVDMVETFGAQKILWDYAESLLVDGDHIICTPGGENALMAALDCETGKTIWKTTGLDERASYCSPIIVNHNGRRLLLNAVQSSIVGIDPETGTLLWSFYHKVNWDIHGVTPVYHDGLVYYTGGDGIGGGVLKIARDGTSVTPLWEDKVLDCLHHGVVFLDGYLYGTGYKAGGKLVCLEMASGNVAWQTREIREGVVVAADGMIYVYEGPEKGIVNLVKVDGSGYEIRGKVTVTQGTGKHWAHPTLANGKLLIRRGTALIAYNVKKNE